MSETKQLEALRDGISVMMTASAVNRMTPIRFGEVLDACDAAIAALAPGEAQPAPVAPPAAPESEIAAWSAANVPPEDKPAAAAPSAASGLPVRAIEYVYGYDDDESPRLFYHRTFVAGTGAQGTSHPLTRISDAAAAIERVEREWRQLSGEHEDACEAQRRRAETAARALAAANERVAGLEAELAALQGETHCGRAYVDADGEHWICTETFPCDRHDAAAPQAAQPAATVSGGLCINPAHGRNESGACTGPLEPAAAGVQGEPPVIAFATNNGSDLIWPNQHANLMEWQASGYRPLIDIAAWRSMRDAYVYERDARAAEAVTLRENERAYLAAVAERDTERAARLRAVAELAVAETDGWKACRYAAINKCAALPFIGEAIAQHLRALPYAPPASSGDAQGGE